MHIISGECDRSGCTTEHVTYSLVKLLHRFGQLLPWKPSAHSCQSFWCSFLKDTRNLDIYIKSSKFESWQQFEMFKWIRGSGTSDLMPCFSTFLSLSPSLWKLTFLFPNPLPMELNTKEFHNHTQILRREFRGNSTIWSECFLSYWTFFIPARPTPWENGKQTKPLPKGKVVPLLLWIECNPL